MLTPNELETLLFSEAPSELFERLLRAAFAAHAIAHEEAYGTYADTEAENVLPYSRRGYLEGGMRDVAAMVPGVTAKAFKSPRSSWNHTEIRSGRVVITASAVQTPCGLVEPSEFRTTLARSAQGVLWPEPGDEPDDSTPLYVLFLHGRSTWVKKEDKAKYGKLLGSAYLALPAPDLTSYVHSINLFEKFPAIVADNMPREWDEEAKVSYLSQSRRIIAS